MSFKFPIRECELLCLKGASEFDPVELTEAVKPLGFTAYTTTRFDVVEQEVKRLIVEKGVSYVWNLIHLMEAIMPPTTDVPALVTVLQGMLRRLEPTAEFVVVDPYLLPTNPPSAYLGTLKVVLEPIVRAVESLTLVTGDRFGEQLVRALGTWVLTANPSCRLTHRTSNDFHDRFWIADRERGLFVGTSLNGIGVRYALADYMQPDDVKKIVAALNASGLI
jgi:hypothetical protein